jgi:hypothetical protein
MPSVKNLESAIKNIDSPLMTRVEAAAYLKIRPQTMALWRQTGRYNLPCIKVGRVCRYRKSDLDAFIASRTVNSGVAAS